MKFELLTEDYSVYIIWFMISELHMVKYWLWLYRNRVYSEEMQSYKLSLIKSDQVKKAIKLVRFFIQTKLRLTGHSGFKSEVPENNMNSIEKKILEMPGEVIFLKHLKHTVKKGEKIF